LALAGAIYQGFQEGLQLLRGESDETAYQIGIQHNGL
jgi:hypothetical protein